MKCNNYIILTRRSRQAIQVYQCRDLIYVVSHYDDMVIYLFVHFNPQLNILFITYNILIRHSLFGHITQVDRYSYFISEVCLMMKRFYRIRHKNNKILIYYIIEYTMRMFIIKCNSKYHRTKKSSIIFIYSFKLYCTKIIKHL